jgi:alpha-D-ribose 1-methylphosphonate 5-triphosphate synthase subunit PhnL
MHIRGGKRVIGFQDVSFRLEPGRFLGVTGPSGVGKSSLLKCIYRTYLPSSGRVLYTRADGEVVDLAGAADHTIIHLRKSEIGYVSQFFHVIPRVTAVDTITKSLVAKGMDGQAGRERARELLSRLGIPQALWELFPSTFSGGEKQRINIIHAIIAKPRLLLLDEPTASLDARSAAEVVGLIRELKDEGTAMVGVFHDVRTLEKLEDERLHIETREPVLHE